MKVYVVLKYFIPDGLYYDRCYDLPAEIISVHLEKWGAKSEVEKLEAEKNPQVWYDWYEKEITVA